MPISLLHLFAREWMGRPIITKVQQTSDFQAENTEKKNAFQASPQNKRKIDVSYVHGIVSPLVIEPRILLIGFCSSNKGGRWNTTDAARIKIPAVKPHIMYFLFCSSKSK